MLKVETNGSLTTPGTTSLDREHGLTVNRAGASTIVAAEMENRVESHQGVADSAA